jgi:N-acetylmuramoyl-L-alanine amidase
VDAGHGGTDPGKIGVNGAFEKDINLSIALKLAALLEQKGISVTLTRDSDTGLYDDSSVNKKVDDMQKRCLIISEANPLFTVSIHQNSYTSPDVSGAQVFYYGQSSEGEELAGFLQDSLIERVDSDNHRVPKANESYYLLKKTPTPTVIVECGFLSNPIEADKLCDDNYQNTLARAVYMGICKYLDDRGIMRSEAPAYRG